MREESFFEVVYWWYIDASLNLGATLYKPFNAQAVQPTELTTLTIAVSLAGASGDALGSIALREARPALRTFG